jgi:hypothetical protein
MVPGVALLGAGKSIDHRRLARGLCDISGVVTARGPACRVADAVSGQLK